MLDGRRRDSRDELAGEDYIAALLKDPRTPPPVVRRGLRMLRPDHPALTLDLLERFLDSADEATRIEAVRSLRRGPPRRRFAILARIASDPIRPEPIRAEAIAGLADDADHQRDRLLALATDEPPACATRPCGACGASSSPPEDLARLREANRDDPAALELIDRLGCRGSRRRSAGRQPDAAGRRLARPAGGPGRPVGRGAGLLPSKGPGCYRCHQVDGRGGQAGPDLSTLASATDRRRLVESIVAPSREIAPQFVSWSVARTDGTVFTGILLEQSPDGTLVFADSEGRRIAVKPDEIAERKPQTTSIMPDNLPQLDDAPGDARPDRVPRPSIRREAQPIDVVD